MGRRLTGAVLCLAAAILFAARYLSAAIFMSGVSSWDAGLFAAGLEYVGTPLLALSVAALAAGVLFLIWGECTEGRRK